ncbi:ATP-binding protein [Paractinoplanes atraurantiacus]|uniref:Histidine kinase-like ATPase domain-containing protein n=1 Tax=Paractinoplanes atraurantiacus TaxID=1036182 RepID=A0A285IJ00_9ACTN|nr:ATP-binding protein [Actinoplanes atraurantiacus]SNY47056.1 Histidine kinase-like ATPase domain-containing protein [Actinoplanes atraurantiacus]
MQALRLPFDHGTDSASLRHAAHRWLVSRQDGEVVEDTLLVMTELVQNVVQHTGDGGEVALSADGDVLVEVFDSSRDLPRLLGPDPRRLGGRGMLLVDAVSDDWGSRLTADGKVVWARLPVKPGPS